MSKPLIVKTLRLDEEKSQQLSRRSTKIEVNIEQHMEPSETRRFTTET
jgi:hypothetical protein